MATLAHPVGKVRTTFATNTRSLVFVLLAVSIPIFAGLAWHLASDNPVWPLMRSSMNLCSLHETSLSPISPDGRYRVHVVHASLLGRFEETLVFLSPADEPWPVLSAADPDRAVLEVAGDRSLDAITWQTASEQTPMLQLWFAPGAAANQIHRVERSWRNVSIATLTSQPAPGAERLDY